MRGRGFSTHPAVLRGALLADSGTAHHEPGTTVEVALLDQCGRRHDPADDRLDGTFVGAEGEHVGLPAPKLPQISAVDTAVARGLSGDTEHRARTPSPTGLQVVAGPPARVPPVPSSHRDPGRGACPAAVRGSDRPPPPGAGARSAARGRVRGRRLAQRAVRRRPARGRPGGAPQLGSGARRGVSVANLQQEILSLARVSKAFWLLERRSRRRRRSARRHGEGPSRPAKSSAALKPSSLRS